MLSEAARPSVTGGVVVDTSRSPHTRLRPLPLAAVRLEDEFWAPRLRINREVTLPGQYEQCEQTGRIDNFRRAAGKKDVPFQGIYFNDSDVYKWVEAVSYALATDPDPQLERMLNTVVTEIADAQDADGYLNTYFTFERKSERWTNLRDLHELYCAGHLFQAAVAHHRATGQTTLLEVATRFADHITATFGPEARAGACGHEEIELALVELYRETGHERYLRQAQFFLDQRGRKPPVVGGSPYHQDHMPFRELDQVVGHAVRMVYLTCGAADLFAETGEPALLEALERLWHNMVERHTYVTGGIGARYEGEAFGDDYEMPNERAYAETCAAIGSVMWNWRMLAISGQVRFADALETTLYNGVLSGLSLDGQTYFYQNPLADRGRHRRQPWFGCACCPPNIARLLASLPGYFYSASEEGIWVHLYASGSATALLGTASGGRRDGMGSGRPGRLTLRQRTRYPWDGEVEIVVETEASSPFSLFLRIPSWCEAAQVHINGEAAEAEARPGSFLELHRQWRTGDTVRLSLPMPVRRVECHPYVANNSGRVALTRGPLVYCLEGTDHPGTDLREIVLPAEAELNAAFQSDLLGGVVQLWGSAIIEPATAWEGRLYRAAAGKGKGAALRKPGTLPLQAVPYYAWANREPGPMQVWTRSQ
jgi:DUF1680 family protein